MSFLPQFLTPGDPRRAVHLIEMGGVFAAMTLAFLTTLGLGAGLVGAWLLRRPGAARGVRVAAGGILMALGLRLLLPQKT